MNTRRELGNARSYAAGVIAGAGRLVVISGTVALDQNGRVVGPGSVGEQARFIFGEIGKLLEEADGSLSDVLKLTTYLTDMTRYREFAEARAAAFAGRPKPASAAVGVAALIDPALLVEIEALAMLGDKND